MGNPIYGQPGPPEALTPPSYKLFDSVSVLLATLLGSPVAGTVLMGVNYRRLGKVGLAAIAIAAGGAATALAIIFGNMIPPALSTVVAIGLLLTTKSCAQVLQGPALADHVSRGGKLGSRWAAAGIGVAFLAVIFGVVFVVILGKDIAGGRTSTSEKTKVTIGTNDTLYYSDASTKDDAEALGNKLKEIGYFTDRGVTVLLSKKKNDAVVSFVVKDGVWNNPDTVTAFQQIGGTIAPVLGKSAVDVRMVDKEAQETKKEFNAGRTIVGAKDEVYFAGTATESEAKALGDALRQSGYLEDRGVSVLLYKGEATMLSFVLKEGIWDKPASVSAYEKIARQVAPQIGGLPMELRLLNSSLETKKEITIQ